MKIGEIYNLDTFKQLCNSDNHRHFSDSYTGTVLARNLTAINPKIFEKRFPELAFVNSGVTFDNTGGFAQRIQSLRLVALGGFTNAAM